MNRIVIEAGRLPASVFFIGDTHIGNAGCDYIKLAEAVKYIKNKAKETTVIMVGMGDYIDAITLDDKRFNPLETDADFPLHDLSRAQMRKFYELTREAWETSTHAVALVGNHEEKFITKKNFDVYSYFLDDLSGGKIMKGGFECLIRLLFNSHGTARHAYDIYSVHGATAGGWREGAGINTIYDLSRYYTADCYVMGHLHKLDARVSSHLYLNHVHQLEASTKHYGVSGSFLLRHVEGHRSYMEGRRGEPTTIGMLRLDLSVKQDRIVSNLVPVIF